MGRKGNELMHLADFTENGLLKLLGRQMCKHCKADDCDCCPGIDITDELETQISEQGMVYMRQIVKDWEENSVE